VTTPVKLDDAARQARLDRMKRIATGLLGVATLIFIAAWLLEARFPWLGFVKATAEAAMIGGLADWFAVTALFRHPLGIPIPHTAIVPKRKDHVGRILGSFVQRHFLSPDVISTKLRSAQVAAKLGDWLSDPEHARAVARQAAVALSAGAKATQHETMQDLIQGAITRKVEKTQVAPLLGKVLGVVMADHRHQELFDEAIELIARAVHENKDFVRERIEQESPWWVPDKIDEKIASKITRAIDRTLQQIKDNAGHPIRERFDSALYRFIERLKTEPAVIARAEAIKREMLDDEAVRAFAGSLWDDVNHALVRVAENPEARSLDAITKALVAFGDALKNDPGLTEKVDTWIIEFATEFVERYREDIGSTIEETVGRWDPEATSKRIELAVGPDLQYIRMNGTLVGGLAGLVIYTITRLF
jgi:uncharacterized membrane-anchored protein YjiN (DUF445 family)